jgi:hypothetical protein
VVQQTGSSSQIMTQQSASLQPGERWGKKQGPAVSNPQPWRQRWSAVATQNESHWFVQQLGSMAQTAEQQAASSQKGVSLLSRQPPVLKEPHWSSLPQ